MSKADKKDKAVKDETIKAPDGLFLSDTARAMLRDKLEKEFALKDVNKMSDEELVNAVANAASDSKKRADNTAVDRLKDALNSYLAKCGDDVPSKVLLDRLFHLNVPHFYAKLFRDQDERMTDQEIWEFIRKSKISPLSVKEIFK